MKILSRQHAARIGVALIVLLLSHSCTRQKSDEPVVIPAPLSASASGLWSSPGTWGGGKPADYQTVTIPSGISVTLDENTPALGVLIVSGSLAFADRDLELRAGRIEVHGTMEAGTETAPFSRQAVITLGGNPGDSGSPLGNGFLVMGTLDLHGEARATGWTRLARTAPAGDNQLVLQQAVDWRPGDHIVIASTDFDMNQAEEMIVSAASGTVVTLGAPLLYTHWGANEFGVEERAEVGLLTRNVKVQGYSGSVNDGKGGHLMAMAGSTMRVSGVEFTRMGKRGELARYSVHFHMMGDATGSYVKDSAIHHNFNRCVTIHGSHNTVVSGNVAYDTLGHCFFFEDGIEHGNLLENNLGLVARLPDPADQLTDSDATPATFWITNPDNTIRGNAAAGAEAFGIWYDLDTHPSGLSTTDSIFPINTPLGEFSGNVTHSNGINGLFVDHIDGTGFYDPKAGGVPTGQPVEALFSDLVSYKNRRTGMWIRCFNVTAADFKLADNLFGAYLASHTDAVFKTFLINSVIVGETGNLGNPSGNDPRGVDGRNLPSPGDPSYPLVGIQMYDGLIGLTNVFFANFQSNAQRPAGALSDKRFDQYGWNTDNFMQGLTFSNANQVYFDPMGASPDRPNDEDGHRSALFIDKDGSVAGLAGQTVTINNPFLVDDACNFQTAWNAYVCPPTHKFGRLIVENKDTFPVSIAPIRVIRVDGAVQTLAGMPYKSPRYQFNTSLLDTRSYHLEFNGPAPQKLHMVYRHRQPGDWIELYLPYPSSTTPTVVRDGNTANSLTAAASLADLSASTGNVYFHDGTNLHLKIMIQAGRTDTTVDVGP